MWAVICLCLFGVVSSANVPPIPPCNIEDSACITKLSTWVYGNSVKGVPELNIESADPMYTDVIKADLETIKFELRNCTTNGFKDCEMKEVKVIKTPEKSTMYTNMFCPRLTMVGLYDIDGKFVDIPVQGKGNFEVDAKEYQINIVSDLQSTNKDGKRYISIKNSEINAELLGDLHFVMHNLFNGNKELADPVNKFIKENPKLTVKLLDKPVFEKNLGKLIDGFNKQLEVLPVENIVA